LNFGVEYVAYFCVLQKVPKTTAILDIIEVHLEYQICENSFFSLSNTVVKKFFNRSCTKRKGLSIRMNDDCTGSFETRRDEG